MVSTPTSSIQHSPCAPAISMLSSSPLIADEPIATTMDENSGKLSYVSYVAKAMYVRI